MMPGYQTEAIVLRHAAYRDCDRMVTLFSPTHGRIEALARGCKKMGSVMTAASELFSTGVYQLYAKGERTTMTGFSLQEGFYPLRTQVERLAYGCYALGLCAAAIQPGEPEPELYASLQRALAFLAYDDCPEKTVATCFLTSFSACVGFQPELDHCAHCGKPVGDRAVYDLEAGGIFHPDCMPRGKTIRPEVLRWLREVRAQDYGVCSIAEPAVVDAALTWMRGHVEYHMQGAVRAAKFLSYCQ